AVAPEARRAADEVLPGDGLFHRVEGVADKESPPFSHGLDRARREARPVDRGLEVRDVAHAWLHFPSTRPRRAPVAPGSVDGMPSAQRAPSTAKTSASRAFGSTPASSDVATRQGARSASARISVRLFT